MKNKPTPAELYKQTLDYVAFLRKRLDSANYKANVTEAEYEKTQAKYDKAKTLLKFLKPKE